MHLSIILAAHHEGLIAHKTMLSLFRAIKPLQRKAVSYEVIVTIDNGNTETIEYFSRYEQDSNITVYPIDKKDLAGSRNFGVEKSKGRFIATLDADDLISENWLLEAVAKLEAAVSPVVLHTQYSVNFGTQDIIWEKFDSRGKDEDAIIMTYANRWDSAIVAPREVFERFPYQPNTKGFGSEDWHFNSQTLAANIPHLVVPETILFVRRKDVSEMTIQASSRRTLHYTELLSFDYIRSLDRPSELSVDVVQPQKLIDLGVVRASSVKVTKKLYHATQKMPGLSAVSSKLKDLYTQSRSNRDTTRFPVWLMDEWRAIHALEKEIFPSRDIIESIPIYHSEMLEIGAAFKSLVDHTTQNPDYIVFVPYLSKGGADLVALNYVSALTELYPSKHFAVVATENQASPWKERLPKSVDFIPFGPIMHHFSEDVQLQCLARFIVQSGAKSLQIIQSPLAFRFVELYDTLLTQNDYTIYAAAFCEDTDNEGRVAGHVHSGLPYAYPSISKVFSDNEYINKLLVDEYAFSLGKFTTHYQPVTPTYEWSPINRGKKTKLIWAGRIAKQKRPDILVEIAKRLDPKIFTIDVYGSFQDGYDETLFDSIESIQYRGGFNGIGSLRLDDYSAYLYTSENDGLPNMLLEIGSGGMPIIAPAIGGIPELIQHNKTGFLIQEYDNPKEYLDIIVSIQKDTAILKTVSEGIRNITKKRHSKKHFISDLQRDIQL